MSLPSLGEGVAASSVGTFVSQIAEKPAILPTMERGKYKQTWKDHI